MNAGRKHAISVPDVTSSWVWGCLILILYLGGPSYAAFLLASQSQPTVIVVVAMLFGGPLLARQLEKMLSGRRLLNVAELAYRDELTGLANRRRFSERLAEVVAQKKDCAVLLIDLDRFKLINDTMGHPAGDSYLIEISGRLLRVTPPGAWIARLGGDEFSIVVEEYANPQELSLLANRILDDVNEPMNLEGQQVWPSASIGIAVSEQPRLTASELLSRADIALYQAKEAGRGQYAMFQASVPVPSAGRLSMEAELRNALGTDQLMLFYQPIIDLKTNHIEGFEALVRWLHPRHGLLKPVDFVPMAEESGLIRLLGRWILAEACRQAREWHDLYGANFDMNINLSALQFRSFAFLPELTEVLRTTGIKQGRIHLEITETAMMQDEEATMKNLDYLRNLGVNVAIDDFGVGYSSLSYLRRFQVETLKLDLSFVQGSDDARTFAIIKAMVDLGHALDMRVIAEGIETKEQIDRVIAAGCDYGQGFLLGEPQRAGRVNRLLAEGAMVGDRRIADDGPRLLRTA